MEGLRIVVSMFGGVCDRSGGLPGGLDVVSDVHSMMLGLFLRGVVAPLDVTSVESGGGVGIRGIVGGFHPSVNSLFLIASAERSGK